jgi:hypothetical protein
MIEELSVGERGEMIFDGKTILDRRHGPMGKTFVRRVLTVNRDAQENHCVFMMRQKYDMRVLYEQ